MGNLKFALPGMRDALEAADPDVVFLQEVQGQHIQFRKEIKNWPRKRQHQYLAGDRWPHAIYGKNALYKHGHHGNAILSKFDILEWENVDVSRQKFSSRSVLHAEICVSETNRNLHIMCIHFGLFKKERSEQLQLLCQRINEHVPEDEPLIIAGDFNDWLKSADEELQHVLHLKEAFHETTGKYAKTFPVLQPLLSVDRVYYRGLEPLKTTCLNRNPWTKLSDHAALYVEFEFK